MVSNFPSRSVAKLSGHDSCESKRRPEIQPYTNWITILDS